jgi:hypothetical protein
MSVREREARVRPRGKKVFVVGGLRYTVDLGEFNEFLSRLGRFGYAGNVEQFESLDDEMKRNYLEGFRLWGGNVSAYDANGKEVDMPKPESGKEVVIPLPV